MSKFIWTEDTHDGFNVVMSFSSEKINVELVGEKWFVDGFTNHNLIARNNVFDSICRNIGLNKDYQKLIMNKKVGRDLEAAGKIARHTCKTMYKHFVKQAAQRMKDLTSALGDDIVKFHKKVFTVLGPKKYSDCNFIDVDRKSIVDSPMLIHLAFANNSADLENVIKSKDKKLLETSKKLRKFSSRLSCYVPMLKLKKSYSNLNEFAFSLFIADSYPRDKNGRIVLDKFHDVKLKDIKKAMGIYNSFTKKNLNMRKIDNIQELCYFVFNEVKAINLNDNIVEATKKACYNKIIVIQDFLSKKGFADRKRPELINFENKHITFLDTDQKVIDCGLNFGKNFYYLTVRDGYLFYVDYNGEKCIVCLRRGGYFCVEQSLVGNNKKSSKYAEKILSKLKLTNASNCPF